ncbi:TetR/AcrR family transcriptional regulator [Agromyces sp. Soil535]|uniref:TetR/AcrR family transcriptional regulator n=1 Tax=Agromyces sp. Soil535 TaxID=1736390 RepID=UPI0006F487C7|nr:TetR/AcrR family transcriptional regulator [Agromyces sp. Soil535]KRE23041.1 hypothetical protein ASG80_09285 [Agromyces sp. Soil535]
MSNKVAATRLSPEGRREQIIDVASRHLSQGGSDGLSIQAVAAEAGVTRALVHHYFGGKESLLDAVISRELIRLRQATEPDATLWPAENLDRALNAYFDFFSASSGELRAFYLSAPATPRQQAAIAENHAVQVEWILSLLDVPDTSASRLAVAAWLAFAVQAAKESVNRPDVSRTEVLQLCKATLGTVVDLAQAG